MKTWDVVSSSASSSQEDSKGKSKTEIDFFCEGEREKSIHTYIRGENSELGEGWIDRYLNTTSDAGGAAFIPVAGSKETAGVFCEARLTVRAARVCLLCRKRMADTGFFRTAMKAQNDKKKQM